MKSYEHYIIPTFCIFFIFIFSVWTSNICCEEYSNHVNSHLGNDGNDTIIYINNYVVSIKNDTEDIFFELHLYVKDKKNNELLYKSKCGFSHYEGYKICDLEGNGNKQLLLWIVAGISSYIMGELVIFDFNIGVKPLIDIATFNSELTNDNPPRIRCTNRYPAFIDGTAFDYYLKYSKGKMYLDDHYKSPRLKKLFDNDEPITSFEGSILAYGDIVSEDSICEKPDMVKPTLDCIFMEAKLSGMVKQLIKWYDRNYNCPDKAEFKKNMLEAIEEDYQSYKGELFIYDKDSITNRN